MSQVAPQNPTVHATVTDTTALQDSAQVKSAKTQRKKEKKEQRKKASAEKAPSQPSHPHPDGRDSIRVHEIYEVYGYNVSPQDFRNAGVNVSRGTRVTAEQVKRAHEESLEGAAILRDIDTQWGMIPGGGAYKESNHYFGPGFDDYY